MAFQKFELTNDGINLLAQVQAELGSLNFTKIKIGSGVYAGDIKLLTDVITEFHNFPVTSTQVQPDKSVKIQAPFDNSTFTQAHSWREIGIYAKLGETGQEVLYSYSSDPTPDTIPDYDGGLNKYRRTLDIRNYISDVASVTLTVVNLTNKYDFNTVAEMVAAAHLVDGDRIKLWGYYSLGDGAEHERIKGPTDLGNGIPLDSGGFANLQTSDVINVMHLGAKPNDLSFNNLDIFNKALETRNTVYVPRESFFIEGTIKVFSYQLLKLEYGAILDFTQNSTANCIITCASSSFENVFIKLDYIFEATAVRVSTDTNDAPEAEFLKPYANGFIPAVTNTTDVGSLYSNLFDNLYIVKKSIGVGYCKGNDGHIKGTGLLIDATINTTDYPAFMWKSLFDKVKIFGGFEYGVYMESTIQNQANWAHDIELSNFMVRGALFPYYFKNCQFINLTNPSSSCTKSVEGTVYSEAPVTLEWCNSINITRSKFWDVDSEHHVVDNALNMKGICNSIRFDDMQANFKNTVDRVAYSRTESLYSLVYSIAGNQQNIAGSDLRLPKVNNTDPLNNYNMDSSSRDTMKVRRFETDGLNTKLYPIGFMEIGLTDENPLDPHLIIFEKTSDDHIKKGIIGTTTINTDQNFNNLILTRSLFDHSATLDYFPDYYSRKITITESGVPRDIFIIYIDVEEKTLGSYYRSANMMFISMYGFNYDPNRFGSIEKTSIPVDVVIIEDKTNDGLRHDYGSTANRPTKPRIGQMYYDLNINSSIGVPIWWDGTNWKDSTGTVV